VQVYTCEFTHYFAMDHFEGIKEETDKSLMMESVMCRNMSETYLHL